MTAEVSAFVADVAAAVAEVDADVALPLALDAEVAAFVALVEADEDEPDALLAEVAAAVADDDALAALPAAAVALSIGPSVAIASVRSTSPSTTVTPSIQSLLTSAVIFTVLMSKSRLRVAVDGYVPLAVTHVQVAFGML
jgi:hypothetical protein